MAKIKVVPFCGDQKDSAKALEDYWAIASPEEIERMKIDVFYPSKNLRQRKEAYQKHKKTILLLKPAFKRLIIELNKMAKCRGYKNYWEYTAKYRCVPKKKQDYFFENADLVIDSINKNLPIPRNTPLWYWSKLNIPDALDLVDSKKYLIPDDIYKIVKGIVPALEKFAKRIIVAEKTDFCPAAIFKKDTKTVIIKIPSGERRIYGMLTFVHELGHAISILKYADKGLDPYKKSKYWHEKQAYQFKFKFEDECLPRKVRNASRGEILGDFLTTLFEYEIYNNPNQDFDEAYANAINRCYPKANQERNPFYVLENGLIARPCSTMVTSVVEAELLSKELP